MPIKGIYQPDYINFNNNFRLKSYDGQYHFAYDWYQDVDSLELIDGKGKAVPYTYERLKKMYDYLQKVGELYFIEKKIGSSYVPIGDVTFSKEDMPIVISKEYRKQGIGNMVIQCLIERAKTLGYESINVEEIYNFNIGSQKLFEGNGFSKDNITEDGASYYIDLK